MNPKTEIAAAKFLSGYNCAQSILYAYGPDLGLDGDMALRLATGLGAGMGRRGEACGAVTGGILALGLKYGRREGQDRAATEETYQKTLELMERFEKKHGSCQCRALIEGCDLRTEAGQRYFKEHDLLHKVCLPCVQSVAEALGEMLGAPTMPMGGENNR